MATVQEIINKSGGNTIPVTGNEPGGIMNQTGAVQSAYQSVPTVPASAAVPVTPATPTPAAVPAAPTTAPEPTIAEQLAGIESQALTIQDELNRRANFSAGIPDIYGDANVESYLQGQAYNPVNEDDIRRNTMNQFQTEIDAVNQAYDQLLGEEKLRGEGRIGSQTAIGARSGILGSDFAGAQKKNVQDYNVGIQRGIEAERATKIGAIMGTARSDAAAEIAAKNQARQQGAESYLAYLSNKGTVKSQNIQNLAGSFLSQGLSPDELDPTQLDQIAKTYGTSVDDIKAAYQMAATQGAGSEGQFTLSSGEQRYDSAGNLIAAGPASAEADGKIYSTSKGLVRIGADGNPELIFGTGGGGSASSGKGFTSGGLTVSADNVSAMSKNLEESRVNGYVPAEMYTNIVGQLTSQGAVLEDIVNRFPPKDYLDPADSNVPPHIANKLKTQDLYSQFFGGTTPATETPTEEDDSQNWFQSLLGL